MMADTQDVTSSSDSDGAMGKKNNKAKKEQINNYLKSGSIALTKNNTPKDAAENYKSALDLVSGKHTLEKITDTELILRYAMCVAWIRCSDYREIVRGLESLKQLLDCGYGEKLPALYLTLARAYIALNRFKKALDPIEQAMKIVENSHTLTTFFWPGLYCPIDETIKDKLQESLLALQKDCGAYHTPDAICRYDKEKCLNLSGHIIPSQEIFFSDPDFHPVIILQCEAKCKIAYHEACWKHLKNEMSDVDKYKDVIGHDCPTVDCKIVDGEEKSHQSVIVEVSMVGREGFDNPIKKWTLPDNARKQSISGLKRKKDKNLCEKLGHPTDKSPCDGSSNTLDKRPRIARLKATLLKKGIEARDVAGEDSVDSCEKEQDHEGTCTRRGGGSNVSALLNQLDSMAISVTSASLREEMVNIECQRSLNLKSNSELDPHAFRKTWTKQLPTENTVPMYCGPGNSPFFVHPPPVPFAPYYQYVPVIHPLGPPQGPLLVHRLGPPQVPPLDTLQRPPHGSPQGPFHPATFVPGFSQQFPYYAGPSIQYINQTDVAAQNVAPWTSPHHSHLPRGTVHSLKDHGAVVLSKESFMPGSSSPITRNSPSGKTNKVTCIEEQNCSRIIIGSTTPLSSQGVQPQHMSPAPASRKAALSSIHEGEKHCALQSLEVDQTRSGSCSSALSKYSEGEKAPPGPCICMCNSCTESLKVCDYDSNSCIPGVCVSSRRTVNMDTDCEISVELSDSEAIAAEAANLCPRDTCFESNNSETEEAISVKACISSASLCSSSRSSPCQSSCLSPTLNTTTHSNSKSPPSCLSPAAPVFVFQGSSEVYNSDDNESSSLSHPLSREAPSLMPNNSPTHKKSSPLSPPLFPPPSVSISDISMTLTPFQAKAKTMRPKEKKPSPDPPACPSTRSLMDPPAAPPVATREPSAEEQLAAGVEVLRKARRMSFGYTEDNYLNPELQNFGCPENRNSEFVEDEDSAFNETEEYVSSWYHSIIKERGIMKIEELEEKFKTDKVEFGWPPEFLEKYPSIAKFLLRSRKFAAIDDMIATAELLPDMYSKAETELTESVSFILFNQVLKPRSKDDRVSPEPLLVSPITLNQTSREPILNDTSPHQVNSASHFDNHIRLNSTSSTSTFEEDNDDEDNANEDDNIYNTVTELEVHFDNPSAFLNKKDKNENPVNENATNHTHIDLSPPLISNLNVHSLPYEPENLNSISQDVYMSEDDDAIDGSIDEIDDWPPVKNGMEEYMAPQPYEPPPGAVLLDEAPVAHSVHCSEGINKPAVLIEQRTESIIAKASKIDEIKAQLDALQAEKEEFLALKEAFMAEQEAFKAQKASMKAEKESSKKELQTLKYEKTELLQRITTLQTQMETVREQQEVQYGKALKQAQEKSEQKLESLKQANKNLESKLSNMEASLTRAMQMMKDSETQVSKLQSELEKSASVADSLRKKQEEHIKYLERSLKESKDEILKLEGMVLKMWKTNADLKIQKFNEKSLDRIEVLNDLKALMADSQPLTEVLRDTIRSYEENMLSVNKKTETINTIFREHENCLHQGSRICLDVGGRLKPLEEFNLERMDVRFPVQDVVNHLRQFIPLPYSPALRAPLPYYNGPGASNSHNNFHIPYLNGGPTQHMNEKLQANAQQQMQTQGSLFSQHSPLISHHTMWQTSNSQLSQPQTQSHQSKTSQGISIPSLLSLEIQQPQQAQQALSQVAPGPAPIRPPPPQPQLQPAQNSMIQSAQAVLSSARSSASSSPSPSPGPAVNGAPKAQPSTPIKVPPSMPVTSSTGAIPKVRVQTAAAGLTPIVATTIKAIPRLPAKPGVNMKIVESNYQKLMRSLQKMFPTRAEGDLAQALKIAREKNGNTLSSLSHAEIIMKVDEALKNIKKQTAMGLEKFGEVAWASTKTPAIDWEGSTDDECTICMNPMNEGVYTLQCKHAFHETCIRKWLSKNSICPNCRKHSTMQDEFPPLG